MTIRSYHDLSVWQLGMDLTELVYGVTSTFPDDERYGLISQMRRAAASIPANIAEGHGRDSTREYIRHLSIAMGSLCEVETFVQLSRRRGYASEKELDDLEGMIQHEGRMLRSLQKSLRGRVNSS